LTEQGERTNAWSCTPEELEAVGTTMAAFAEGGNLIAALIAVQREVGWLPAEGMKIIAAKLGVSETTVYSVATFYNRFRFVPPGRRQVSVCMGTACHVKRGNIILDSWKRRLGINEGETTPDREYSLDRVDCVGCCAMAPVTVVDGEAKGKMTPASVDGLLVQHGLEDGRGGPAATKNGGPERGNKDD